MTTIVLGIFCLVVGIILGNSLLPPRVFLKLLKSKQQSAELDDEDGGQPAKATVQDADEVARRFSQLEKRVKKLEKAK
jgi:hypothetical protein